MNPEVTPNTPGLIRSVRAELAAVQTRTCGHGIDRGRAKCAECEPVNRTDQLKEPA